MLLRAGSTMRSDIPVPIRAASPRAAPATIMATDARFQTTLSMGTSWGTRALAALVLPPALGPMGTASATCMGRPPSGGLTVTTRGGDPGLTMLNQPSSDAATLS
jgi:hypothetical protein